MNFATSSSHSLHNPERFPGESFSDYRLRRESSRASIQNATLSAHRKAPGHQAPNCREQERNRRRERGGFKGRERFADTLMSAWAALRRQEFDLLRQEKAAGR